MQHTKKNGKVDHVVTLDMFEVAAALRDYAVKQLAIKGQVVKSELPYGQLNLSSSGRCHGYIGGDSSVQLVFTTEE